MNKLIFDLGFHSISNHTKKYLNNGYQIVAIEADKRLCDVRYPGLTIINKCIWKTSGEKIPFYLSNTFDVWNSAFREISERLDESVTVFVETITLSDLIKEYGTPIYCKIDIEGADIIALESLKGIPERPKFISCETECLGNDRKEDYLDYDGLDIIRCLKDLGYTRFFLHDENYHKRGYREFLLDPEKEYNNWKSYDEICEELKTLRKEHIFNNWYDFWYDVYATF